MKTAVVIPVYREESRINSLINHLRDRACQESVELEIVVVDGDPEGSTVSLVQDRDVKLVKSETGRAKQMNRGVQESDAENLLFLHAETRLPEKGLRAVERSLSSGFEAGAFSLEVRSRNLFLRFVSVMTNLRSALTRVPYGDQAIFVKSSLFKKLGGFPEIPIMEDVAFMTKLRKRGMKIKILRERVSTSARRWRKEGFLYCTLRNRLISTLYSLGVPAERLAHLYRRNR